MDLSLTTIIILALAIGIVILLAKAFVRIAIVVAVALIGFTLFFGDGLLYLSRATQHFNEDLATKIESFYLDFKDRADYFSKIDTQKLIDDFKAYIDGSLERLALKENLEKLLSESMDLETFDQLVRHIEDSVKTKAISEEFDAFLDEHFKEETKEKIIEFLSEYFLSED